MKSKIQKISFFAVAILIFSVLACKDSKNRVKENKNVEVEAESNQEPKLIVLAGQSNMVGVGNRTEGKLPSELPKITYVNHGKSSSLKPAGTNSFGPDWGVMKALSSSFPNEEFIVYKYAVGGSSLYDWWPEQDADRVSEMGHPKFGNLHDSLVKYIPKGKDGKTMIPDAFLWIQGETDARFSQAGEEYFSGFSDLISSFKKSSKNDQLPVIIGQINPPTERYPAAVAVMEAQQRAATELPNTYMITTEGIAKRDDNLHYNTEGQIELGRRFGEKLVELLKK
ncbi:hypothetical protein D1013_17710 [Euzebyella marina]|uniref:Sialate O-acetylesterase domain-containing protein n=1 Tax=Euzebyella marina TaxID=1761453 RepID=A0A3G2LA18_9FLAO|nr:sialate O-acetylesterase [Euzebyella marina]AYN69084.1 hypothetical protein D1013_17710 [Euzebyella marina]